MYTWMQTGQGADGELQVSTIHTTSCCSALNKVLIEDKNVLHVEFQRILQFTCATAAEGDSSYMKRKKWTKKAKDKKALWFSSQAVSMSAPHYVLGQVLQCTREALRHIQVVQKGFKDFPREGDNPEDNRM